MLRSSVLAASIELIKTSIKDWVKSLSMLTAVNNLLNSLRHDNTVIEFY